MNAQALTPSHATAWRCAFAEALIELRPDMNPDAADELSDSAFLSLCDMAPQDAAAQWAGHGTVSTVAQAADLAKRGKSGDPAAQAPGQS